MYGALSDEQKVEIRRRVAAGESQASVGLDLGVSQASVSRVVAEGGPPAPEPGPLATATAAFLDALELAGDRRLRGLAILSLAGKIDWASSSTSVGASASLPGLVRQYLAELGAIAPEPDVAAEVSRMLAPLRGLPSA